MLRAMAICYPVTLDEIEKIFAICNSYDMTMKSIEWGLSHNVSLSHYAECDGQDVE